MEISLSGGILHGYSLWPELEVSCASLNTTTTDSILGIVEMTVEYLLGQSERPVESLPYFGQVVEKYGIGRCDRRTRFFWSRRVGRK
jgi:hypothetical protein